MISGAKIEIVEIPPSHKNKFCPPHGELQSIIFVINQYPPDPKSEEAPNFFDPYARKTVVVVVFAF